MRYQKYRLKWPLTASQLINIDDMFSVIFEDLRKVVTFTQDTPPLAGTKTYWVADSSGGAVTRKLTFVDGVLVAET